MGGSTRLRRRRSSGSERLENVGVLPVVFHGEVLERKKEETGKAKRKRVEGKDNLTSRDLDRQIGIQELQGSKVINRWADIVVNESGGQLIHRVVNEPNTEQNNTVSRDKDPTDKRADHEATIGLTSDSLEPVSPKGIRQPFSPDWANSIDLINNENSSTQTLKLQHLILRPRDEPELNQFALTRQIVELCKNFDKAHGVAYSSRAK
ncbi:hypothetical protein V6N12_047932 [Hibiscus sabdariffa]|uniref:Uncharacterized protein n=1 Tax=Hibiscus sabdariffa TaxID=183260 RepID=A0ABR2CUU3_9ROSI